MKKLNCAIIGCGNIGCSFDDYSKIIKTHAGGYFHNSNTKLLALCDIDKNKLKKYGKKYQINKLYTDPTQLFSNNAIDILSNFRHLPYKSNNFKLNSSKIIVEFLLATTI